MPAHRPDPSGSPSRAASRARELRLQIASQLGGALHEPLLNKDIERLTGHSAGEWVPPVGGPMDPGREHIHHFESARNAETG